MLESRVGERCPAATDSSCLVRCTGTAEDRDRSQYRLFLDSSTGTLNPPVKPLAPPLSGEVSRAASDGLGTHVDDNPQAKVQAALR